MAAKKKIAHHKASARKTAKGMVAVAPFQRKVSVSFNPDSKKGGKLKPSIYGLESPAEVRQAAKIIKAAHQHGIC